MRDRAQLGEQPVELVVGEDERVAAGEQHVADLGRGADPGERDFELALLHGPVLVADHALPQAEAAVERALVVHAEGDAVGVDADHVLHRRVGDLVERVGEAGRVVELGRPRHHLPADRTRRVVRVHQRRVVGRDHEAEALGERVDRPPLVRGRLDVALEVLGAPDAVLHLPDPVAPLGLGDPARSRHVWEASNRDAACQIGGRTVANQLATHARPATPRRPRGPPVWAIAPGWAPLPLQSGHLPG